MFYWVKVRTSRSPVQNLYSHISQLISNAHSSMRACINVDFGPRNPEYGFACSSKMSVMCDSAVTVPLSMIISAVRAAKLTPPQNKTEPPPKFTLSDMAHCAYGSPGLQYTPGRNIAAAPKRAATKGSLVDQSYGISS